MGGGGHLGPPCAFNSNLCFPLCLLKAQTVLVMSSSRRARANPSQVVAAERAAAAAARMRVRQGPFLLLPGAVEAAAALGSAIGRATGGKKKKRSRRPDLVSALGTRNPNPPQRRLASSVPGVLASGVASPSPPITVPFDNVSLPVFINSGGTAIVVGSTTAAQFGVLFDPSAGIGGYYPFGVPLNTIQGVYRRWRLARLRIRWRTALASTSVLPAAIGTLADGGIAPGTAPSVPNLMSVNGARTFNLALDDVEIGTNFVSEWLYSRDTTVITTSSRRLTDAGALMISAFTGAALPAASSLVGFLQFSGVAQFADLADGFGLDDAVAPVPASPSLAVPASAASVTSTSTTVPVPLHNCHAACASSCDSGYVSIEECLPSARRMRVG